MASSPRDENRTAGLVAKSDADNTPVVIEADATTKRLKVNTTVTGTIVTAASASRTGVFVGNATCTATTSPVSLIAAAGANVFTDILDLRLINTSATGTEVDISDGTNTYYYYAPPTDMRGIVIHTPDPATTTNTAWTITTITSVSSVKATVKYIKN